MSNTYTISDGALTQSARETTAPGAGEVTVEIHASSINYRDLGIQAGFTLTLALCRSLMALGR